MNRAANANIENSINNIFYILMLALFMCIPFIAESNNAMILPQDTLLEKAEYDRNLQKHISKLNQKSRANFTFFLENVFYKTHRKFLKDYDKSSTFSDLLAKGDYSCVSGSILYSYIFQHLDIDHTIIETDTHIFIVVRFNGKEYVVESTDPVDGLITDEEKVIAYIASYKPSTSNVQGQSVNTIYNDVSFKELLGLQYYNVALYAIDRKEVSIADLFLDRAISFYQSDRIKAVKDYLTSIK